MQTADGCLGRGESCDGIAPEQTGFVEFRQSIEQMARRMGCPPVPAHRIEDPYGLLP